MCNVTAVQNQYLRGTEILQNGVCRGRLAAVNLALNMYRNRVSIVNGPGVSRVLVGRHHSSHDAHAPKCPSLIG